MHSEPVIYGQDQTSRKIGLKLLHVFLAGRVEFKERIPIMPFRWRRISVARETKQKPGRLALEDAIKSNANSRQKDRQAAALREENYNAHIYL